jgi:hypothetical protein
LVLGHWREELIVDAFGCDFLAHIEGRIRLGSDGPQWQREAGHFRVDWGHHDQPNGWADNMLKAYFDRWEIVREKSFQYLLLKSNIRADILIRDSLEQDVPRRLALAPPALVVLEQAELF